jgi:hypothetical protein
MMSDLAESITEGLFSGFTSWKGNVRLGSLTDTPGNQKGGIIKAPNGMYISGNRTGDRNLALLEDGEYVLNRNLVKDVGRENLDAMNFGMSSRFQSGGLSSKGRGRFGGIPGTGKSYPRKFFDAGPLTLESGNQLSRFTDDVVTIDTSGKIVPLDPLNMVEFPDDTSNLVQDFSKKLRYTGRSSFGLHLTETGLAGRVKNYVFKKDGKGGYLPSHGITIGDIRDIDNNAIEIDAIRGGKNIIVKKQKGGFFSETSTKDKEEAQKELGIALNSSAYHGGQTGFWLANNPTARRLQGFLEERQQERWQKEWEKEQKKTAMYKGLASTAISFGLSYGAGKLFGGKPSGGDMWGDEPPSGLNEAQAQRWTEMGPDMYNQTFPETVGARGFFNRNMSSDAWSSYDWGGAWRNEKPWFNQGSRRRGRGGGRQSGGYIDNIPALLTGGEFVVGRNAVQHYGTGYLNQINRMQDGGLVGNTAFNQGGDAASGSSGAAPTTNHNNVGITVNFGADANPEVKTVQSGAQEDPKMFAGKIRAAVMDVINQEQRVGGRLRAQRKGRG